MAESNHFSERLREPLNETTRRARRNLLAASVIGVIITRVGLVPEKISAFGIEFTSANQQALLTLLLAAIAYFAVNFVVYVYSELTAWQIVITSKDIEELKAESERKRQPKAFFRGKDDADKFREHIRWLYLRSKPTFYLRLSVELLIPIIFAVYSSYTLITFDVSFDKSAVSTSTESANEVLQPTAKNDD